MVFIEPALRKLSSPCRFFHQSASDMRTSRFRHFPLTFFTLPQCAKQKSRRYFNTADHGFGCVQKFHRISSRFQQPGFPSPCLGGQSGSGFCQLACSWFGSVTSRSTPSDKAKIGPLILAGEMRAFCFFFLFSSEPFRDYLILALLHHDNVCFPDSRSSAVPLQNLVLAFVLPQHDFAWNGFPSSIIINF